MQALSTGEPLLRSLGSFVRNQTKGEVMRFRIALGAVMVVALSAVAGIAGAAPGNNYTCAGGSYNRA